MDYRTESVGSHLVSDNKEASTLLKNFNLFYNSLGDPLESLPASTISKQATERAKGSGNQGQLARRQRLQSARLSSISKRHMDAMGTSYEASETKVSAHSSRYKHPVNLKQKFSRIPLPPKGQTKAENAYDPNTDISVQNSKYSGPGRRSNIIAKQNFGLKKSLNGQQLGRNSSMGNNRKDITNYKDESTSAKHQSAVAKTEKDQQPETKNVAELGRKMSQKRHDSNQSSQSSKRAERVFQKGRRSDMTSDQVHFGSYDMIPKKNYPNDTTQNRNSRLLQRPSSGQRVRVSQNNSRPVSATEKNFISHQKRLSSKQKTQPSQRSSRMGSCRRPPCQGISGEAGAIPSALSRKQKQGPSRYFYASGSNKIDMFVGASTSTKQLNRSSKRVSEFQVLDQDDSEGKLPPFINIGSSHMMAQNPSVPDRLNATTDYGQVVKRNVTGQITSTSVTQSTQQADLTAQYRIKTTKPRQAGPIRVDSFHSRQDGDEFSKANRSGSRTTKNRDKVITRDDLVQNELDEAIERKKQFEEEVKVARLTGFSKHTSGSANSLEYSPSPKRGAGITPINESPILVQQQLDRTQHDESFNILQKHEPGQVDATRNHFNFENNNIRASTTGYEFSPEVRVCDATAINTSFDYNSILKEGNAKRNQDIYDDLKNENPTTETLAQMLQLKRPNRIHRISSARPNQFGQIKQKKSLHSRSNRNSAMTANAILAQSQEPEKQENLFKRKAITFEKSMNDHLSSLAKQMQKSIEKQQQMFSIPIPEATISTHTGFEQFMPKSTKLQPEDLRPSYQKRQRIQSANVSQAHSSGGKQNRIRRLKRSPKRDIQVEVFETEKVQSVAYKPRPQRIHSALPAGRRPRMIIRDQTISDQSFKYEPMMRSQKALRNDSEEDLGISAQSSSVRGPSLRREQLHGATSLNSSKFGASQTTYSKQYEVQAMRRGKKGKLVFEDEKEEAKYRGYMKHVRTLNKMKEYLGSMHKSMSRDVIKKLVVSIKKMEEDLNFYENNWSLFQSANLDYEKGVKDDKLPLSHLDYPEIIREGEPYLNFNKSKMAQREDSYTDKMISGRGLPGQVEGV